MSFSLREPTETKKKFLLCQYPKPVVYDKNLVILNPDGSTQKGSYKYTGHKDDVIRNSCPLDKNKQGVLVTDCNECWFNKLGLGYDGKVHFICSAQPILAPGIDQHPDNLDELIDGFTWHRELSDDDKMQDQTKKF
ncbi:hypothetical protein LCGC14_0266940 [marine sediment metagenome]|uniref:Uncharacterized protein n=1 Tax=marine sediment metagenome TaxID=412755 RepID=A0A0F9X4P0_9ZZZZ